MDNLALINIRNKNLKLIIWLVAALVFGLIFIISFSSSFLAPFDIDTPYDPSSSKDFIIKYPKKRFYLSSLQMWKMGSYFFLIFYICITISLTIYLIKNAKSKQIDKYFFLNIFSILFIPMIINLINQIKEFKRLNKNISFKNYLKTQESKNQIKFGKQNLFFTIAATSLLVVMILYKIVDGIIYSKDTHNFSYNALSLLSWPFEYVTAITNHFVLIYIILFFILKKYKFFDSSRLLTFCISYLCFVGLIYNAILLPDYLKEKNHPFMVANTIIKHVITVVFSIIFWISFVYTKRKYIKHQKFDYLRLEAMIFSFGIPYLIYVFIIPFIVNYSMYKITNLNSDAWIISGGKVVFGGLENILWIFLGLGLILVVSSVFYAIEALIIKKYNKAKMLNKNFNI